MKYVHQRRKVVEELAWFDRHLFGTHEETNLALKNGSPLAAALKLAGVAKEGGLYGGRVGTTFVPEVVEHAGIRLGRFEVTRAQFASFDGGYEYPVGTGDFPANGVPFERATAYCESLTGRTGETYRLPLESEVAPIYEAARGSGNTLDYWAGYAPNRDDAGRLVAEITRLPGALAMAEGQSVTTPGVLNLPRKLKNAAIRIEKDGYRPAVVRLDRGLSGVLWWNLVLIPTSAAAGWAATPEKSGLDHMFEREENGALAALIVPRIVFWGDSLVGGAYRLDPPYISITPVPLVDDNLPSQAVQRFGGMTYRAL